MKCVFCDKDFDDKFNIGDAYEGLMICPHCRRFNKINF